MSEFERLHKRLLQKATDVTARPVVYVAFGDSVTQGCMEYATIEHDKVFHNQLKRSIEKRYPSTIFSVINSGVSGDTAHGSRLRWDRDLLMYQPDLVTIGFGVNDAHEGEAGLNNYVESLRELIHRIRTETEANLLLLTPNMMIKHDNANVDEQDRPVLPVFIKTAEAGYLHMYVEALRELAEQEQVACVDQYAWWMQMEQQGTDIHTRLINGINHPDREFHQELADMIDASLFPS
jgi:acyl-CoA thioesterase-1